MKRSAAVALSLIGCVFLGATPRVEGSTRAPLADEAAVSTKLLIKELLEAGERVSRDQIQALAAVGSTAAAEGLHKVASELRGGRPVRIAYAGFREFAKHPEALEYVVKALSKDAMGHKRESHQIGAASALARLGPAAEEALIHLVRKSKDEGIRRTAVVPVVEVLARMGDMNSLDLLFENAPLEGATRTKVIAALIESVTKEGAGRTVAAELAERLASRKTSTAVKSLLLQVLAKHPSEDSVDAILDCLAHDSPEVQLTAIEIVGQLEDPEHLRRLESLARSDDDAVTRAALGSIGQILKDDVDVLRKARRWAKEKRAGARMGACLVLVHGTDEASAASLRELLVDKDWRVRTEALQQVVQQRRSSDIPLLIERMGVEEGRLSSDIAEVLRHLTGLDHGQTAARWSAWWEGEGERFQMPTLAEAAKALAKRRKRADAGRSAASFYGINVQSGSVAFVVDVSGSMNRSAKKSGATRRGGESPTRLEVAREQLAKTIDELANGVQFNIVVFGTQTRSWQPDQRTMNSKNRASALEFVSEIRLAGGTNTFGGLMAAFENAEVDTIYLLSDGRPSDGELIRPADIRQRIQLLNSVRKVRIHCISIGQASAFMRDLASDTGGRSIEVL